jgi:hypothetical protein
MRPVRIVLALAVAFVVQAAVPAVVAAPEARQYYGKSWAYNSAKKYYYREYHYKKKATDTTYQKQYMIYYKEDPKKKNWVYYYSPATEKVWCRYPTKVHPTYGESVVEKKELWSVLPKEKRKKDVYAIDDGDYGKVGATCPTLPDSDDKASMEMPPADLP